MKATLEKVQKIKQNKKGKKAMQNKTKNECKQVKLFMIEYYTKGGGLRYIHIASKGEEEATKYFYNKYKDILHSIRSIKQL